MLKISVLSTGSHGNCYILQANGRKLIIEAGIKYREILKGLDFDIESVDGVLVTHGHSDHVLSASNFEELGFEVWKPYAEENRTSNKRVFGDFVVKCFLVPHDGTDCYGFLIENNGEKLLYATDFEYLPFAFKKQKLDHLMIEVNYCDELVSDEAANFNHKLRGHCSLKTAIGIVEANRTENLKTVIAIHASRMDFDEQQVTEEFQNVAGDGVKVYVAKKGMEIEL